ncbi:hypothetical protein ABH935_004929 [Catenulispora sp. GAS73]|uniref:hypothetical protein n=1 Tax=Catenulispora sp. GAS73 TaxID=3156269 RepID=UPI003512CE10
MAGDRGASAGGSGGSGSFKDTLKNIHATAQTSGFIEYRDSALLTKINKGKDVWTSPFSLLYNHGEGPFLQYGGELPPLTGFDAQQATSAISVGNPPNTVGVLYGSFDTSTIGTKLAAWGYTKQDRGGGVTAWIFKDDNQADTSQPDTMNVGPGMGGRLNVIWVSKSSIAYGYMTSDLASALPAQSKPLSQDAMVGPLTDCLGSTLIAYVITDQKVICVAAPTTAGAQALAAGFMKSVGSGRDPEGDKPWSSEVSDAQTKVLGGPTHVVQLTATQIGGGLPFVDEPVNRNDYPTLLWLPTTSSLHCGGRTGTAWNRGQR